MNEIDIDKFTTNVLESSREAPIGSYYPALVVGLGGSGCRILRHLKRLLKDSKVKQIRLLGIDSDDSENSKFTPELPPLHDTELVLLSAPVAIGALERAAVKNPKPSDSHVLDYLPPKFHFVVKEKIVTNKGAGQFRRAGKLLFCSNVGDGAKLRDRLVKIKEDLAGLVTATGKMREGMQIELGVQVFVVGSLAGGTGAGALIDCLALLRQHFQGQNDVITGVFVLPGELFDRILFDPHIEKRQTRGNALGVLRELQAFMIPRDATDAFDQASHEFVFDVNIRGRLGTNKLVNDVYLVDHHTKDGRLASDVGDVFRAVSLFIYSHVGSGVGASKASGRINPSQATADKVDLTIHENDEPCIFNAFGVSVIEYPVEDILHYAVRAALNQHLKQWLDANKGDALATDVEGLLTSSGLADLAAMRRTLTPEGSAPAMTANWRETTRKLNDAEFFETIMRFRQNVERDLGDLQASMAALAEQRAQSLSSNLEQRTREWGATGLRGLQSALVSLREHFKQLEKSRQHEADKRERRMVELEKALTKRAKLINIIDFGLDPGLRKKYLNDIAELVQSAWHESLDVNLSGMLMALSRKIAEIETQVDQLAVQVRTCIKNNAEKVTEIEKSQPQSCFVQSVLKPAEYRQWVETNLVTSAKIAPLGGFHVKDLLKAILEPLLPNFRQRLKSLNVKAESEQNKAVAVAIRSAVYISQPLVHLIPSAPPESAMKPQRYVAGDFQAQEDPFVRQMFTDGKTESVQTGDPRRIVCVSTISRFAAAHWSGFDVAEGFYRENPWYYHIWGDPDALPEIRPPDCNELALKRDFGLALLFEMIVARGANFYRNLAADPAQDIAVYLLYKDQWGKAACALLASQLPLVRLASTDRRKPKKDNLLGESLTKALGTFSKGTQGVFRQLVSETVNEFVERVGRVEMKRLVDEFVEHELANQLGIAVDDSDRKRSLEDIRTALGKYATQLA